MATELTQAEIIAAAVQAAIEATSNNNTTDEAPEVEITETSAEALNVSAKSGC